MKIKKWRKELKFDQNLQKELVFFQICIKNMQYTH